MAPMTNSVKNIEGQPAWLGWKQAVTYSGLGERTLRREATRGAFETRMFTTGDGQKGRRRRLINRASLDQWITDLPNGFGA